MQQIYFLVHYSAIGIIQFRPIIILTESVMIKLNENDKFKQNEKPRWKARPKDQNKRPQRNIISKPLVHYSNVIMNFNRQNESEEITNRDMNKRTKTNSDSKKNGMETRVLTQNSHNNNSNKIENTQLNQQSENNVLVKQKSNKKQEHQCQNYFLRKTIFFLFTFFSKSQYIWDVNRLTYRQLLTILKELKYIRYCDQESYTDSTKQVSEQLKKCYYLYISISQGKTFSLLNLIIALCCLENLAFDSNLIKEIIQELSQEINDSKIESKLSDPKYIFFTKRQSLTFQNDVLKPSQKEIGKIQHSLKSFRDTKMMLSSSCGEQNIEHEIEQAYSLPVLSKKSKQLAVNRRQKMLEEIKRKKPQIQQIELHHILSYKENMPAKVEHQVKVAIKQPTKADKRQKGVNRKNKQKEFKLRNNKGKQDNGFGKQNEMGQDLKQKRQGRINFQTENNQETEKKMEIIDELEWQQIPKPIEDITFENELLNLKDDFKIALPLSQTDKSSKQSEKEKKRREYLELPILYVDVNIEEGKKERIVIYQGDKAVDLAVQFCKKHNLPTETIGQLQILLEQQIGSVLTKIEEAIEQDCSYLY